MNLDLQRLGGETVEFQCLVCDTVFDPYTHGEDCPYCAEADDVDIPAGLGFDEARERRGQWLAVAAMSVLLCALPPLLVSVLA